MEIGLTLMIVGMVTVFIVLLIIINLSKLLISIVNKVAPEEAVKHKTAPAAAAIPQEIMAVISCGKGRKNIKRSIRTKKQLYHNG